jgi:hypothetical protein
MNKTNFFSSTLPFNTWVVLTTPQKIIGKMNLQSLLNKNSPWIDIDNRIGCDMLGVAKKLVKYVVCLSKKQNKKRLYFYSHKVPK